MTDESANLAEQLVQCGRLLWRAGLVAGPAGNVSVRLTDRILITPSGKPLVMLSPQDLVEIDLAGRRLGGFHSPSSELDLHLRVYRTLPDCGAVVHAHPPTATGFAVAGQTLDYPILPEVVIELGPVPLVPYANPGTPDLADAVEPYLTRHTALLLANHGALSWGNDLWSAWSRMETLEHGAKVILAARSLGRATKLNREQLDALAQPGRTPRHG